MSGAVPLLPLYAFVAQTKKISHLKLVGCLTCCSLLTSQSSSRSATQYTYMTREGLLRLICSPAKPPASSLLIHVFSAPCAKFAQQNTVKLQNWTMINSKRHLEMFCTHKQICDDIYTVNRGAVKSRTHSLVLRKKIVSGSR